MNSDGGGIFLPFDVIDILDGLMSRATRVYIALLRYPEIERDWLGDFGEGEWIGAIIPANKAQLKSVIPILNRSYSDRVWSALIATRLIVEIDNESIFLTMFKKWSLVTEEEMQAGLKRIFVEQAKRLKHLEQYVEKIGLLSGTEGDDV